MVLTGGHFRHVSLQDSKGGLLVDRHECTNNIEIQRTRAETSEIEERIALINEQADLLRQQITDAQKQLADKRRQIAIRISDISSATHDIHARRSNEQDKVQQSIKRLAYESDKTHASTMEMRSYLVHSTADIAGLKLLKRRTKDGEIRETCHIGPDLDRHRTFSKSGRHVKIWDLRELNGMLELCIRLISNFQLTLAQTLHRTNFRHPCLLSHNF